jgi:cytochrome c oxidase assembly protein subunit 15
MSRLVIENALTGSAQQAFGPCSAPLRTTPRWLHRWAILTVSATVVLLGLGSAVTTFRAGMADPVWPTAPTALLQASAEQLDDLRFVIEHSHRLAGWLVGACTIVLAGWLWLVERRRWLAWLGVVALVGISVQGVIGGLRVTEHARWGLQLRIVHGCFAQVVLALLVSVAVFTSPSWIAPLPVSMERGAAGRLRRSAGLALALIYLQIVFGVLLRHTYDPLAQRLHLLTAFAALAAVVWMIKILLEQPDRALALAAGVLACVLGLQLLLGVEAWMVQLSSGTLPELLPVTARRVMVRTAHVLGGSLVLAATVTAVLLTYRKYAMTDEQPEAAA